MRPVFLRFFALFCALFWDWACFWGLGLFWDWDCFWDLACFGTGLVFFKGALRTVLRAVLDVDLCAVLTLSDLWQLAGGYGELSHSAYAA